jgi:hypothetical protein
VLNASRTLRASGSYYYDYYGGPEAGRGSKVGKDQRRQGMIRLFNVYYPTRTLVLLLCEALLVGGSFLLATTYLCLIGPDGYIALLIYENGLLKIAGITVLTCFSLLLRPV